VKNEWEKISPAPEGEALKKPGYFRVKVTPLLAEKWLLLNVVNRRVRKNLVDYLAEQIIKGEWQSEQPQPLVFSDCGHFIDGQHRLRAIVATGVSCVCFVKTGVPEGVRSYLDTGISRNLEDRVEFDPDPLSNKLYAQVVTSWWFCGTHIGGRPSPETGLRFFDEHEKAIRAICSVRKRDKALGRIAIRIAACEFYERDPEMALKFYSELFEVDSKIQQVRIFRDWCLRNISGNTTSSTQVELRRRAVYCMSCYQQGKTINSVREGSWPS
jgi:hypothetical protein